MSMGPTPGTRLACPGLALQQHPLLAGGALSVNTERAGNLSFSLFIPLTNEWQKGPPWAQPGPRARRGGFASKREDPLFPHTRRWFRVVSPVGRPSLASWSPPPSALSLASEKGPGKKLGVGRLPLLPSATCAALSPGGGGEKLDK